MKHRLSFIIQVTGTINTTSYVFQCILQENKLKKAIAIDLHCEADPVPKGQLGVRVRSEIRPNEFQHVPNYEFLNCKDSMT